MSLNTLNRLSRLGDIGQQIGSTLANSFTDMFMSFIEGGKSAIDIVADLLKSLAKLMLNNVFQGLFGGLFSGGGFLGGLFGGGGGIPGFANGTRSAPGGLAWVGERGRELVNLPRGSQVIPHSKISTGNGGTVVNHFAFTVEGSSGNPQQDAAYVDQIQRGFEAAVKRVLVDNMRTDGVLKPRL